VCSAGERLDERHFSPIHLGLVPHEGCVVRLSRGSVRRKIGRISSSVSKLADTKAIMIKAARQKAGPGVLVHGGNEMSAMYSEVARSAMQGCGSVASRTCMMCYLRYQKPEQLWKKAF